jgi:YgiT-type zinc finger domain-containing protein
MKCLYCQGELVQKKVSYTATRRGYHLIIDDVPAWVCDQCGEVLFDEETVRAIQEMLGELGDRVERLTALSLATA